MGCFDPDAAKKRIAPRCRSIQVDTSLVLGAIDLHLVHRLSFWDALIVKAAVAGGCRCLYSEDLQHGRIVEGVRIENPFIGLV